MTEILTENKPINIVVFGLAGAGKTSLCSRLVDPLGNGDVDPFSGGAKTCVKHEFEHDGTTYCLWDTPGFGATVIHGKADDIYYETVRAWDNAKDMATQLSNELGEFGNFDMFIYVRSKYDHLPSEMTRSMMEAMGKFFINFKLSTMVVFTAWDFLSEVVAASNHLYNTQRNAITIKKLMNCVRTTFRGIGEYYNNKGTFNGSVYLVNTEFYADDEMGDREMDKNEKQKKKKKKSITVQLLDCKKRIVTEVNNVFGGTERKNKKERRKSSIVSIEPKKADVVSGDIQNDRDYLRGAWMMDDDEDPSYVDYDRFMVVRSRIFKRASKYRVDEEHELWDIYRKVYINTSYIEQLEEQAELMKRGDDAAGKRKKKKEPRQPSSLENYVWWKTFLG